jgi:uncharacterized protein (DUF1015 family)
LAEIYPFKGIHYDAARVPLDRVIAPPYDVLSPAQQSDLYRQDPRNIVRIILNRTEPGDDDTNNRYSRAAAFLRDWLAEGVFVEDAGPGYYEYVQRFAHPDHPGRAVERRTLFVGLKLEPYEKGVVLPHEETHPKAKADRLELMRATRANPEPIYALYEDPSHAVAGLLAPSRGEAEPLLRATVPAAEGGLPDEHIVYRHAGADLADALAEFMAPRRVWIADGHHRYETALNYRRERRQQDGDPSGIRGYDSLLVGLSAFEDPGLVVLPTHRLVRNVPADRMGALLPQLQRYFQVRSLSTDRALEWIRTEEPQATRFALLHAGGAFGLTVRDMRQAEAGAAEGHCEAWKRLDVTILQTLVLDRTLGISWQALAHTPDVAYTRDIDEAVAKVASGEFQIACLLQNPTVEEVRDVAAAGDKMPQKSTFFYPKLWSGLILRSVD